MQKNHLQEIEHSIHQRVERTMRSKFVLISVIAIMAVTILKLDSRFSGTLHHVYAQGLGVIGNYMREETTRRPVDFGANVRNAFVSGQ